MSADSSSTSQPVAHLFSSDMDDSAARMVRTSMTALKQRSQSTFIRQSIIANSLISSANVTIPLVGVSLRKKMSIAAPISTAVDLLHTPEIAITDACLPNIATHQSVIAEPIHDDEPPPVILHEAPKAKAVTVVDCAIVLNEFKILIGA